MSDLAGAIFTWASIGVIATVIGLYALLTWRKERANRKSNEILLVLPAKMGVLDEHGRVVNEWTRKDLGLDGGKPVNTDGLPSVVPDVQETGEPSDDEGGSGKWR